MRYYGARPPSYRSWPRPPRELEAEMEAAGRDGDDARLGILHARYIAWANDNGYSTAPQGRPERADRAAQ